MDYQDISKKVILVTGAASGLAIPIIRRFADYNARLVLVDVLERELVHIGRECRGRATMITADLTKDFEINKVKDTLDRIGQLDVLVNLAETYTSGSVQSTSMKDFDDLIAVNVRAVFNLTKICVPYLIRSKGVIVNVTSKSSRRVFTHEVAYSMGKVMVNQLTRCLAKELELKGVRVNGLNPGTVEAATIDRISVAFGGSESNRSLAGNSESSAKDRRQSTFGVGRASSTIDEVAEAIEFLAFGGYGVFTGQIVNMGGDFGSVDLF